MLNKILDTEDKKKNETEQKIILKKKCLTNVMNYIIKKLNQDDLDFLNTSNISIGLGKEYTNYTYSKKIENLIFIWVH